MQIETNTLNVLKNFSRINPSIIVEAGDILKTMNHNKTIMSTVKSKTSFDKRFAIYNLDRFLSTISLFETPELNFGDKSVEISDKNKKTRYMYADENTVTKAPAKELKLPSEDVSFKLTSDNLKDIEKASGVLGLDHIIVHGDGKNIFLEAVNIKEKTEGGEQGGDVYSIDVGETNNNFKIVFKFENLKILPGEYNVTISKQKISKFEGINFPFEVTYFIAVETSSVFE